MRFNSGFKGLMDAYVCPFCRLHSQITQTATSKYKSSSDKWKQ